MSVSRHHADWLNLVEHSGPFFSLPVLSRVFSSGLDPRDTAQAKRLRDAYEVWQDNPTAAGKQHAWVMHVLTELLLYPEKLIAEGQAIPPGLEARMAEMGETLRPDFALLTPAGRESAGQAQMLVSIYPPEQQLDKPVAGKHWKATPATRMMELLHGTGIPLGLAANGEQWMLVYAPRGETTGYASWYASLWMDEPITLRAFHSLLGTHRFFGVAAANTPLGMLKESANDQQEVTDQLGYQVREAVEVLVQSFDTLDKESGRKLLQGVAASSLYDAALTVMMRLVFLFSAEERGMLQLGKPLYDDNYAVSTLQELLQEVADRYGEEVLERRTDAWARLLASFRSVHGGVHHQDLSMPAYGGSLFDPDRYPFLEGRAADTSWKNTVAEPLAINNRVVLHLLNALQRLRVKGATAGGLAETRRVSFRALGVEQIGHVYEGLLDHTAITASGPVLGLKGSSKKEPEVALSTLEGLLAEGEDKLIAFLKEETGRTPAALKKLLSGSTFLDEHKLLIACGQDQDLLGRVRPFAGVVREDSFERPLVILPGSVYVTDSTTRRSTGTHYTPPSLTEPIVRHTLEPLVYQGPAEGWPREQWALKSPREILELKVCDMAMGSGAFLVQACRYLAERLVEAWENEEKKHPDEVLLTPEGGFSKGEPSERLVPVDPAERLAIARRVVADRCLYGVDINHMAVEMAKLSLWLITMDPKRPFSFLDHAFKCGDSLLGITSTDELDWFYIDPISGQQRLGGCAGLIAELGALRSQLEGLPSENPQDIEHKAALLEETHARAWQLHILADTLSVARLHHTKVKSRTAYLETAALSDIGSLEAEARRLLTRHRPFHWALEFPEVMVNGGFDGFIGNPPFLGGKRIGQSLGDDYFSFLKEFIISEKGAGDFSVFFFKRALMLLRTPGYSGLIATDTFTEGDTLKCGSEHIVKNGAKYYRAVPKMKWPGTAAVDVCIVHFAKGDWKGVRKINQQSVENISALLSAADGHTNVLELKSRKGKAAKGVTPLGEGFVLSPELATHFIDLDKKNAEIIKPYLNGQDFNSDFKQRPSRFIIDFGDMNEDEAKKYHAPFSRLVELVKPVRDKLHRQIHEVCFWKHWDRRSNFFKKLPEGKVLVTALISKHWALAFVEPGYVYDQKVIVFAENTMRGFGIYQSNIHEAWARRDGGLNIGPTPSYTVSSNFNTFPVPAGYFNSTTPDNIDIIEKAAAAYHEYRHQAMIRGECGLTKIYNKYHEPSEKSDIVLKLRRLHAELDKAVSLAYGWQDIDFGHDFYETKQGIRYTISEAARREILDRLLELNHQRYAEEVAAGLHDKKSTKAADSSKRGRKPAQISASPQVDMFSPLSLFEELADPEASQKTAVCGEDALLSWLRKNPDWHGKEAILLGSGYPENRWNLGIKAVLENGLVERVGERRGARYRIKQ